MTHIYLVDYIGVHCGMHYYLEAFKKVLSDIPDTEAVVLSNYPDKTGSRPFFINHYKGGKLQKGLSLLRNLNRLRSFVKNNSHDIFIYLTYGNPIDIPFLKIISSTPHHIIDIHEAIAQDVDSNLKLKSRLSSIYRNKIKAVISHSSRTDDFLKEYGFGGDRFFVPHFKYIYPKDYELKNIPLEITESVDGDKVNILFFGNINESKGIDILIDSINHLPDNIAEKANFIIAGKDFDGAIDRIPVASNRSVNIFKRHINDDELRFLYSHADYIALPYRKTSQSGILETAFYFKKPIIASDVPYFKKTLQEFPSFGVLAGNSVESYTEGLASIIEKHSECTYFSDEDYSRYENRKEVEDFKHSVSEWIMKIKQ